MNPRSFLSYFWGSLQLFEVNSTNSFKNRICPHDLLGNYSSHSKNTEEHLAEHFQVSAEGKQPVILLVHRFCCLLSGKFLQKKQVRLLPPFLSLLLLVHSCPS